MVDIAAQTCGDPSSIGELPELWMPGECSISEGHHRAGPDDHDDDPDPQVNFLVTDKTWGDPLVDDVGLLEKQLPWRDRGPDNRDDQQHHRRQLPPSWHPRYHKVAGDLTHRWG